MSRIVHQPIHPAVRSRLDPAYVSLHDDILQYCPRTETEPFDPIGSRAKPSPVAHIGQKVVSVGRVEDRTVPTIPAGDRCGGSDVRDIVQARIFTPEEGPARPAAGWPCLVWYHGGGWVVGGLASENGFLAHICKHLRCVVVSINYRHAPEYVYPTAGDDSYAGYEWVLSPATVTELGIDPTKVAIGGLSAGGCITAMVGIRAAEAATSASSSSSSSSSFLTPPIFQLLICPVLDNTATVDTAWKANMYAPWLTPARMQWYRDQYFVGPSAAADAACWQASPGLAPPALLRRSPPTFLAVAGCDLLAPEALAFADKLRTLDVPIDARTYEGGTHSILLLGGTHALSQNLIHDACGALARAFGTTPYDPAAAPILSQDA